MEVASVCIRYNTRFPCSYIYEGCFCMYSVYFGYFFILKHLLYSFHFRFKRDSRQCLSIVQQLLQVVCLMETYCVPRSVLHTLNLVLAFLVTDANRSRRLVVRLTRQWENREPFIITWNSTKLSHRCDLHYLKWLFTSSTFASNQRLLFFFFFFPLSFIFVPHSRDFCSFLSYYNSYSPSFSYYFLSFILSLFLHLLHTVGIWTF